MQFNNDSSTQTGTTLSTTTKYSTKTIPDIEFNSTSGIYNPSLNTLTFFTNNTDALTISSTQVISGNGSGLTLLNYNNLTNKPTNFQCDYNSTLINKPTNFQCDYNSTLINKPTNFQCDYNSTLINKPTNFQSDYNSTVINKPDLSVYATNAKLTSYLTLSGLIPYSTTTQINNTLNSYLLKSGGTITGNIDFGTTISITGAPANYDGGSSVDTGNKTNTYISFKDAGGSTDWCYLRQIGSSNSYKLALDFMDDGNDARFCIRNNQSTLNPDTITEVFTVDNGNVNATGIINGLTLQQNGVGVSTLITNALSSYTNTASLTTLLSAKQPTLTSGTVLLGTGGSITGIDYTNIINKPSTLSQWVSLSGNIYYNSGNIGIGSSYPKYKLQVEDGSIFIGDSTYMTTSLSTANGYRLFFDSTFNGTAGSGIPANKIVLHNANNAWVAGFGLEGASLTYHCTENHSFYTGNSATAYGTRRMILTTAGNLEITGQFITYSSGNGYMTINQGNSTVTGYLEFKNSGGTRMGYIGNVSTNGYIQLQSESTCVGYSINGVLSFGSRLGDYIIKLFGNDYGFGINDSTLRYNSGSTHKFYAGATNTFSIDGTGNISAPGTLNLNSSTQLLSRINLTGQEFYQASNTSTDGIALLLGVNRTGNRQLWIADTSKLTQNATNSMIRITPGGYIDCIASNGTTLLPIYISGSSIWLSAPTQCSSSLGITGTLTANTIISSGLTTSLNAKQDLLTSSTVLLGIGSSITAIDYNNLINKPSIAINQWSSLSGNIYYNLGKVGINNSYPYFTLDAVGTNNGIGRSKLNGGGHDADKVDAFSIGRIDGIVTTEFTGMKCNVTLGSTVGETYSNHSHINFFTWGNNISNSREIARLTSRGRLGILTSSPSYELDTTGSIRATNQIICYPGPGNGHTILNGGGTGATGFIEIKNPSGTRCCYIGAMSNANTYMPIVSESPCIGFDFLGKLKVYGNLLEDYYFNNNGNTHSTNTDFNNITTFGYNFVQGVTNSPSVNGATQYYSWSFGLGSEYAYSSYVCQMAIARNVSNPYLNVRYREGSWGGWNKISAGFSDVATVANNLTGTPNIIVGNINAGATTLNSTLSIAGTTTCTSTLTTAGEIQTTGSNVINFGYNLSKTDGATGRIGYGTYESNALCIVGGSTSGSRKVTIWDYLQINGLLNINGSLTMPNGSFLYGGSNVCKRNGVYLNGVYGGGYYYNTLDYTTYVSSEAGTEFCFRITAYNVDQDIPNACLQCYHVWLRNNNGARTSYATVLGQTSGCGIQIGTVNTNLALTYPNNTAGSGLKHIIFENIAYASS